MKIIRKHQKYKTKDGESFVLEVGGTHIPVMFVAGGSKSCSLCPMKPIGCISYVQCFSRGRLIELEEQL